MAYAHITVYNPDFQRKEPVVHFCATILKDKKTSHQKAYQSLLHLEQNSFKMFQKVFKTFHHVAQDITPSNP